MGFTINVQRGTTSSFLTYNTVNDQGATFRISSSTSDTPALFGIDPLSGILCSNTLNGLDALFADVPNSFGEVTFDGAAVRAGNPSYTGTNVTAVINSDLSLSLTNSQNGVNETNECFNQLTLMRGSSLGYGPITLFAVPVAGVPTTTTTTTAYATTTETPIPIGTYTSFILQARQGTTQTDGMYAMIPQKGARVKSMQFTSNSSAASTFTIDGNQALSVAGYYASVNADVNDAKDYNSPVFFNTQADIALYQSVYLSCTVNPRKQFRCSAGYADIFEVTGSDLYCAASDQIMYSYMFFMADNISFHAPCPGS